MKNLISVPGGTYLSKYGNTHNIINIMLSSQYVTVFFSLCNIFLFFSVFLFLSVML